MGTQTDNTPKLWNRRGKGVLLQSEQQPQRKEIQKEDKEKTNHKPKKGRKPPMNKQNQKYQHVEKEENKLKRKPTQRIQAQVQIWTERRYLSKQQKQQINDK